jgi:hypothetical protein
MSSRVTIGVIALVFAAACGLISALANLRMVEQVNNKLPREERIEPLGWYFSKTQRLHREYMKLHPDGHLLLMVRLLIALMIFGLLVCAWGFGILAAPR